MSVTHKLLDCPKMASFEILDYYLSVFFFFFAYDIIFVCFGL